MTERKPTLQECAMRYGTGMGLLWSFKFMLFPLGLRIPFLLLLFIVLTLGVPILGYIFAKKYRERYCNNAISFGKALLFTIFMYMFASLFVAVVHYIYSLTAVLFLNSIRIWLTNSRQLPKQNFYLLSTNCRKPLIWWQHWLHCKSLSSWYQIIYFTACW